MTRACSGLFNSRSRRRRAQRHVAGNFVRLSRLQPRIGHGAKAGWSFYTPEGFRRLRRLARFRPTLRCPTLKPARQPLQCHNPLDKGVCHEFSVSAECRSPSSTNAGACAPHRCSVIFVSLALKRVHVQREESLALGARRRAGARLPSYRPQPVHLRTL